MNLILSGIHNLDQHISTFLNKPDCYRPSQCPCCGKSGVWMHGVYYRKASCEQGLGCSAPIQRFYCRHCQRTCSVLPEYIPPRRWYHWVIQQLVLQLLISGHSLVDVWNQLPSLAPNRLKLPSRSTIHRWRQGLRWQLCKHHFHLCSVHPDLGRFQSEQSFWRACLDQMSLSKVMLTLNQASHPIP